MDASARTTPPAKTAASIPSISHTTSMPSAGSSPVRRVHSTTDDPSGSPDATPSVKGSAASVTGGCSAIVVTALDGGAGVVAVVESMTGASVVGSLTTVSSSLVERHPTITTADNARNARRDRCIT